MRPRRSLWAMMWVVMAIASTARAASEAVPPETAAQQAVDPQTHAGLAAVLGTDRWLRDFAPLVTERGEDAFLVLFVTDLIGPTELIDPDDSGGCPQEVIGIGLVGTYHVGLVRAGVLVNDVIVPCSGCQGAGTLSFPLRNTRFDNQLYWGQGDATASDDPAAKVIEPTKLIKLADFNGDGHAWEFRLVSFGTCGHTETLLAGYSPRQRHAILFPIADGSTIDYWHDNFYPSPGRPLESTVHYEFPCLDHGADSRTDEWFAYNAALEAWVKTRADHHVCAEDAKPRPASAAVEVRVGSARGLLGETVPLSLSIDPARADVRGVELHLPFDGDFDARECTIVPVTGFHTVRATSWGVEAVLGEIGGRPPDDASTLSPGATLLTCQLAISPYARPGVHRLALSGLLVSDGFRRLPATAIDGEIVVGSDGTPTR